MSIMQPFSPSSLAKFVECPARYAGQYVTKTIKFAESEAMRRGSRLHKCLELSCKKSEYFPEWSPEDRPVRDFCLPVIDLAHKLKKAGWSVMVEKDLAIDRQANPTDFFNPKGFLRCKVDLAAFSPDKSRLFIWDWKSGKTLGKPEQLWLNALALMPETGRVPVTAWFVYFDLHQMDKHDFTPPVANLAMCAEDQAGLFAGLKHDVSRLQSAWLNNAWPPTPGRGCRWCEVTDCRHRGENVRS